MLRSVASDVVSVELDANGKAGIAWIRLPQGQQLDSIYVYSKVIALNISLRSIVTGWAVPRALPCSLVHECKGLNCKPPRQGVHSQWCLNPLAW